MISDRRAQYLACKLSQEIVEHASYDEKSSENFLAELGELTEWVKSSKGYTDPAKKLALTEGQLSAFTDEAVDSFKQALKLKATIRKRLAPIARKLNPDERKKN